MSRRPRAAAGTTKKVNAWRGVAARLCSDGGETCNYNTSNVRQGVVPGRVAWGSAGRPDEWQCERQCQSRRSKRCQTPPTSKTDFAKQTHCIHNTCEKRQLACRSAQCKADCQLRRCSVSPPKAHDCATAREQRVKVSPPATRRRCANRRSRKGRLNKAPQTPSHDGAKKKQNDARPARRQQQKDVVCDAPPLRGTPDRPPPGTT